MPTHSQIRTVTVVFGFVVFLIAGSITAQGAGVCIGHRGNVQLQGSCNDLDQTVDIADLTNIIDHLFITYTPLCCMEEADLSVPADSQIDIADLTVLIDHLFINYQQLPPCGTGSEPSGTLISYTGCKEFSQPGSWYDPPPNNQDCIQYTYDNSSILSLVHVNAGFNCCPVIAADITIDDNTITIEELELDAQCYCLCLFDVSYEISNLSPGEYRVVVIEPYLPPGDEPLDIIINLVQEPSGLQCVTRSQYPWGP